MPLISISDKNDLQEHVEEIGGKIMNKALCYTRIEVENVNSFKSL